MKKYLIILGLIGSGGAHSSPMARSSPQKAPRWMLGPFLKMTENQPEHLLKLGDTLFSESRIRQATVDPQRAFEWQHRLALVSALSNFFEPSLKTTPVLKEEYATQARSLIETALLKDPSLLVRDGAAESIRRIFRMQPREKKYWQKALEKAFLDPKNKVEDEGLFIRETILSTLREASLQPSKRLKNAARDDRNPQVRELLKAWKTAAYDEL